MIRPDLEEIRRTLSTLFEEGDVIELRIFGQEKHYHRIWSGYFDDFDALAQAAHEFSSRPGVYGTYVTVNPCMPALRARAHNRVVPKPKHSTTDKDIEERRLLFVDVDPARPAGVGATDDEKQAARAVAIKVYQYLNKKLGPGIAADSGNGWHILYRLDMPNTDEASDQISQFLQALDFRFSDEAATIDTKVYNASRIIKLYGTPSKKGDSTPDRPHRVSRLTSVPDYLPTLSSVDLHTVIEDLKPPEESRPSDSSGSSFDVTYFLEEANIAFAGPAPWKGGKKWLLPNCPFNDEHENSCYVVQLPSGAVAAGCHHESCSWGWKDLRARYGTSKTQDSSAYPELPSMTDMGNAELLAAKFGRDMLYVSEWGTWAVWDGHRWKADRTGEIVRRAKLVAKLRYDLIAAYDDDKAKARAFKWAQASQSLERIKAMDQLARAEPGMTVTAEKMDLDDWILNCPNGVIDLRTGELVKHERNMLLTKSTGVEFDPDAECPRWEQFLSEIFDGDTALIGYVQKLAGYIITGDCSEQILPIFYGSGNNGKSTFLLTMRQVLGDYARQVAPDILMQNRKDSHPASIAVLKGTRLALTVETGRGKPLDEALVKQLTGGDPIQARFMRQDPFEFLPTHKIVMATNYHPVIKGDDVGIWRRIRLIPFTVNIPKEMVDKHLGDKLEQELPGILAWAVRGCLAWQEHGLPMPEAVSRATSKYRREQDLIGDFLEDHCTLGKKLYATSAELYERYKMWCEDQGMRVPSQRGLGLILGERGFKRGKKGNQRVWYGLALGYQPANDADLVLGREHGVEEVPG